MINLKVTNIHQNIDEFISRIKKSNLDVDHKRLMINAISNKNWKFIYKICLLNIADYVENSILDYDYFDIETISKSVENTDLDLLIQELINRQILSIGSKSTQAIRGQQQFSTQSNSGLQFPQEEYELQQDENNYLVGDQIDKGTVQNTTNSLELIKTFPGNFSDNDFAFDIADNESFTIPDNTIFPGNVWTGHAQSITFGNNIVINGYLDLNENYVSYGENLTVKGDLILIGGNLNLPTSTKVDGKIYVHYATDEFEVLNSLPANLISKVVYSDYCFNNGTNWWGGKEIPKEIIPSYDIVKSNYSDFNFDFKVDGIFEEPNAVQVYERINFIKVMQNNFDNFMPYLHVDEKDNEVEIEKNLIVVTNELFIECPNYSEKTLEWDITKFREVYDNYYHNVYSKVN